MHSSIPPFFPLLPPSHFIWQTSHCQCWVTTEAEAWRQTAQSNVRPAGLQKEELQLQTLNVKKKSRHGVMGGSRGLVLTLPEAASALREASSGTRLCNQAKGLAVGRTLQLSAVTASRADQLPGLGGSRPFAVCWHVCLRAQASALMKKDLASVSQFCCWRLAAGCHCLSIGVI